MTHTDALISGDWLENRLDAPDIKVLDATSFLPTDPRDPLACFHDTRLPSSRFFDINQIADTSCGLSHAMPRPEAFMSKVSRLGVGDGLKVVLYDANGGSSAAMRGWWMFRAFGHTDVAVLDGGLPLWLQNRRPVIDGAPMPLRPRDFRHFTPRDGGPRVADRDAVLHNIDTQAAILIDARAAERFAGEVPEPRPSRALGHIPGAINIPHAVFFNDDKSFKSPEDIRTIFAAAKVEISDRPIIAMCGTGVTACVVAFAAHLIGKSDVAVYDGSWEEWGNTPDLPIASGHRP